MLSAVNDPISFRFVSFSPVSGLWPDGFISFRFVSIFRTDISFVSLPFALETKREPWISPVARESGDPLGYENEDP